MREKLIELLTDNLLHADNPLQLANEEIVDRLADHLLQNGVVVLPCNVGDTVYYAKYDEALKATIVSVELNLNIYGKKSHHLFAWHMSNLVIYDEPKELSEFRNVCKYRNDDNSCKYREIDCDCVKFDFNPDSSVNFAACLNFMTRPPQSWCYVESEV